MSKEECTYSMNNGEGIVGRLLSIYNDRLNNDEFKSEPPGQFVGNIFSDGTIDKQTSGMLLQSFLLKHEKWALNPANIYQIYVYHASYTGYNGYAVFKHGDEYIPFEERATKKYQELMNSFVTDFERENYISSDLTSKCNFIEIEYMKYASNFELFCEIGENCVKSALPSVYNKGFRHICVYICPDETTISLFQK